MKKIFVFILLIFCSAVYAEEDEVYLDLSKQPAKHFDFGQFRYENQASQRDTDDDITPSFSNILRMFKEDVLPDKTENVPVEKNSEQ
ncbi:hypothetical protein IKQ21_04865 [bacterium]|nr:hypothetical protein [bacterium]